MHFLFSKSKSYLCNNPRPKPIAAPENVCLLSCLPLCLHRQHTGSLSFTPAPAFYHFPATLGVTSERSHLSAHYSRAICSIFGMDSCSISPDLQSRHPGPPWLFPAGAGFPRVTLTWRLWSKLLGHPLSSASKVKKLKSFDALENALDFWRSNPTSPHLPCAWHGLERWKPSWAEVAGLIYPHHLPLQKDSLGLGYLLLLLLKQPQLHFPPLAALALSHGSAHPGPLHICREVTWGKGEHGLLCYSACRGCSGSSLL